MNYTLVKGHFRTVFTKLPEGGYNVTQYQFMPGHLNWTPVSGKNVSEEEAKVLTQKLARQEYYLSKA